MESCDNAPLLVQAMDTPSMLEDPATSIRHFALQLPENSTVMIYAEAASGGRDTSRVDPVLKLYGPDTALLATNDDMFPGDTQDARLITRVTTSGRYCFTVQGCTSVFGEMNCHPVSGITSNAFTVWAGVVDPAAGGVATDAEPNNQPTQATVGGVQPATAPGAYRPAFILGTLPADADVDHFSFTVPADLDVPASGRAIMEVSLMPAGTGGGGSTLPGVILSAHNMDGMETLASLAAAQEGRTLRALVQAGSTYLVSVRTPVGAEAGANPFYVMTLAFAYTLGQFDGDAAATMNDTWDTATVVTGNNGVGVFYGLLATDMDQDHFRMDVPGGATQVGLFCEAAWGGAGLTGFQVDFLDQDGMVPEGYTTVREQVGPLSVGPFAIAGGVTSFILRASTTGVSPTVTGRLYGCVLYFP